MTARIFFQDLLRWLHRKRVLSPSQAMPTSHLSLRDLNQLVPVVVPAAWAETHPNYALDETGSVPFLVAWVIPAETSWEYIVRDQAVEWDMAGFDWRALALRNLIRMTELQSDAGKDDENGRAFIRVMLHDDALGPSRLLLPGRYDDCLGQGYKVAIPERSCAVAYRLDLDVSERSDVDGMINGCYEHGTHSVSPERFDARDFWELARQHLPSAAIGPASGT